ncbi:MAG: hydrolase [Pantoea sp.]|uniref:DAPG hydrolase family protein n=1 Tax=Pantoea TaxID=53335 RepID=UPI000F889E76|nr:MULTISPECIES: hydrolase [Pantoea]MDU6434468.1 hydrolase [Pantoea sp.]RTY52553.1 hydrolase [Pantoea sp. YU22]
MRINTDASWDLDRVDILLNPAPLRLEMGISRTADNRLVVAARTDMPGCSGKMLEWWFTYFHTTEHLKWWHPADHKAHYGWDDAWVEGKNFIGATVHAEEALAAVSPVSAKIKFHHPEDFFTAEKIQEARSKGWLSGAVCGCIGFGTDITLDESGDPLGGRMVHLVRDTTWGCVLRSRFILGENMAGKGESVEDEIGFGLLQHCHCEFTSLSKILPSLYYAENTGENVQPPEWW